jgi:hypothetical protein
VAFALLGLVAAAPYAGRLGGGRPTRPLLLVASAGAADVFAALGAKILVDDLALRDWLGALGFGAASAAALAAGLASETAALQWFPASRVGPAVVAMQVAIPVLLAPLVAGEHWGDTPLHGAVLLGSLALVTASGVVLASSSPIVGLGDDERRGGGAVGISDVRRPATVEGPCER